MSLCELRSCVVSVLKCHDASMCVRLPPIDGLQDLASIRAVADMTLCMFVVKSLRRLA